MHTIKNLTNSPYDIVLVNGQKERLPARGEITVDVDPMHLPLYRTIGYFQITETDPLDHDGDGKKGGSKSPEPSDVLSELRAEYTDLFGKKPFNGWDAAELQKRIDAKLEE